jgi:oligopeptide transport system substrate-binding protein
VSRIREPLLLVLLIALVAGSTGSAAAEPPRQVPLDQALVLEGGESSNPRDYDPATTHGSGDKLAFSGLVAFDPQMNLVPDLAQDWHVSADGMTYEFTLRSNARFHDGRQVTSGDVIYSLERTLDPTTQSDTAMTYLGDIAGARDMHEGKAQHVSGMKVIDDSHVQIQIDAPKPYFLLKLTYPTAFIVDKANVESGSDWYRKPNGTGPYKLTSWQSNKEIVYEANREFYLGPPPIPYVVIRLYAGTGMALYEMGDIDMTGVPLSTVDRFLDPEEPLHDELRTSVSLCTGYVTFDVSQPPFDDPKVRQAFTMAFDRQKYIDVVLDGRALPAGGLYPPALPGFDTALKGLPFDPARARQLLAESKYGGAAGLPRIVYTSAGFGSYVDAGEAAMAEMWKKYLGVEIHIENIEPNFYYDGIYSGRHGQLLTTGWCADYPDPENFADVLFHKGAEQNLGRYSNPELDKLLEAARVEQDVTKRIAMYQQAERIIVNDAPVLFTVHHLSYTLVKPYLKGFTPTPIDISSERYMWLEGK